MTPEAAELRDTLVGLLENLYLDLASEQAQVRHNHLTASEPSQNRRETKRDDHRSILR